MISWWQHLSLNMDPVAFTIGSFAFRYYSLFWLIGFFGAGLMLMYLMKRDGCCEAFRETAFDGIFWVFGGALLGGRLGYAILYAPEYFWQHPTSLFIPFENGVFTGFFGMSFFGGVLGSVLVLGLFLCKKKYPFFALSDYYALAAPIALFFGRLGNFFNDELYGRATDFSLGMYFLAGGEVLRHPSQLYEAFLEGILLFVLLLIVRNYCRTPGMISGSFLMGYGVLRFFGEFFREPDPGSGLFFGIFTQGQAYSAPFALGGLMLLYSIQRRKSGILREI